jgi:hypothetical protein
VLPGSCGKLPKEIGMPAGGSLTADQWLLLATVYGPIVVRHQLTQRTACAHHMAQIPELWRQCLPAENDRLVNNRIATIQRTEAEKAAKKKKTETEKMKKKADKEKAAAEKRAEKERIAAEKKADKEKAAAEKRAEKERIAAEKKADKERIAAEKKAKKERIAAEKKAEKERITAEKKAGKAKNGKQKAVPSSSRTEIPEASSVMDTASDNTVPSRTPLGTSSASANTAFTANIELVAAEEHLDDNVAAEEHLDDNIHIDTGEDAAEDDHLDDEPVPAEDRLDDDTGGDLAANTDAPAQFSLHPDDPKNFLKLSAALLLLGKRTITSEDIARADGLIREYCTELITVLISFSRYFHLLTRCYSCMGRR